MTVLTKKPTPDVPHISDDLRYKRWCEALKKKGVHPVIVWEASSRDTGYNDIYYVVFNGDGFTPAHITAIVQWYGPRDGFAVYLQGTGRDMNDEAWLIAGKNAPGFKPAKVKIAALSNQAIDRMDVFVKLASRGVVSGRNDYWNELQAIIDAGVDTEGTA